jgi:hypothetical protein
MHVMDKKCILFSDGIPEWKRPVGRALHRWEIILKVVLMSLNATLTAYAATVKWLKVTVFVVSPCVCIVFCVY